MSQFNTIAGWALAGGIVALGGSIVAGEFFHGERPEQMGYIVEGVVEEGGGEEAEMPIAQAFTLVSAADGEQIFRRCVSCHTINQGGPDGIGPNQFGIVGAPIAAQPGFAYSDALASIEGNWTFDALNDFLRRPAEFAPGTKMSFAGLSNVEDRAAVILYMNEQGSNLPLPPPPTPDAPAEGEEAAAGNETAAETEATTNEAEPAANAAEPPG